MNSKIFNHIKKVIVALAIIVICSPHAAYAVSFYKTGNEEKSFIQRLIDRFFKVEEEENKYENASEFLKNFASTGSKEKDIALIMDYINNNIPAGNTKDEMLATVNTYALLSSSGNSGFNIGSLIGSLMSTLSPLVDGLMGLLGGSSIDAEAQDANITATTAGKFTDGEYEVNLHANVYINPKDKDGKWALVIHPFLMSGKTMANAVGSLYFEQGYNVMAIDLRGFGDSEGTVALGFLESLDAYDWLVYMNHGSFKQDFNVDVNEIIVHGTSLGAATTNFLSGIDGFMREAPRKMDLYSLKEDLNVVGLVEDCGYISMEQFADASFITSLGIGFSEEHFDYYSNAANSLKHCEVPMLIIHGDNDTMVDYNANAPVIAETVKDSRIVTIEGGAHALIMTGSNDEYENAVKQFIEKGSEYAGETQGVVKEPNSSILDLIMKLLGLG